jgi:hypothetical protein
MPLESGLSILIFDCTLQEAVPMKENTSVQMMAMQSIEGVGPFKVGLQ